MPDNKSDNKSEKKCERCDGKGATWVYKSEWKPEYNDYVNVGYPEPCNNCNGTGKSRE